MDPEEAATIGIRDEAGDEAEDDAVAIWPEHEDVVRLFLALGTQWRVGGMAGAPLGLEYGAIETTGRLMGIEVTPDLFADLQVMEAEARDVLIRRMEEATQR